MLWDLMQQTQIGEVSRAAASAEARADTVQAQLKRAEQRMDRLALVCMAMWTLLSERTGITEEDLHNRVREIDLADGSLDGKVRVQPQACPQCKRTLSKRHLRCMYCGRELQPGDGMGAFGPVL